MDTKASLLFFFLNNCRTAFRNWKMLVRWCVQEKEKSFLSAVLFEHTLITESLFSVLECINLCWVLGECPLLFNLYFTSAISGVHHSVFLK